MKKNLTFFLPLLLLLSWQTRAQNADNLYFTSPAVPNINHDYKAASFVVDQFPGSNRGMVLWARSAYSAIANNALTLDELDVSGSPFTQHANIHANVASGNIVAKKIIESCITRHFYMIGHVRNSTHLIGGFTLNFSPVIIKVDANTLNAVWVRKLHFAGMTTALAAREIEYNDITETRNGDLVLAGRYRESPNFPERVLAARLSAAGGLIWSNFYTIAPNCNAAAFSVVEATDLSLSLTGYVEDCTPPAFTGRRKLLYATLTGAGAPILFERVQNAANISLTGDKIVRRTNIAGGDAFFISGFIDIPLATGATNRQILFMDIRQNGVVINTFHIGEAGAEVANDMLFKDLGTGVYHIFLTGSTSSYDPAVRTEAYFCWLKYDGFGLGLNEFVRYPRPTTSYTARTGVELKKAGTDRFAILANNVYTVGVPAQNREFSNIFIRDLADPGNCIKPQNPPIVFIGMETPTYAKTQTPILTLYGETYTVTPRIPFQRECNPGNFKVDPTAATIVNCKPDQILRAQPVNPLVTAEEPEVKAFGIFPNPVKNSLQIDLSSWNMPGKAVHVQIYTSEMRLVKETKMTVGTAIDVAALPEGLYFVRVTGDRQKGLGRFVKE
jgi:Secretion system C-terminal sorting domain